MGRIQSYRIAMILLILSLIFCQAKTKIYMVDTEESQHTNTLKPAQVDHYLKTGSGRLALPGRDYHSEKEILSAVKVFREFLTRYKKILGRKTQSTLSTQVKK